MTPDPGIDINSIKEKARKDLLDLLEAVCKAQPVNFFGNSMLSLLRFEARRMLSLSSHLQVQ